MRSSHADVFRSRPDPYQKLWIPSDFQDRLSLIEKSFSATSSARPSGIIDFKCSAATSVRK